jgi:hypothetical protein
LVSAFAETCINLVTVPRRCRALPKKIVTIFPNLPLGFVGIVTLVILSLCPQPPLSDASTILRRDVLLILVVFSPLPNAGQPLPYPTQVLSYAGMIFFPSSICNPFTSSLSGNGLNLSLFSSPRYFLTFVTTYMRLFFLCYMLFSPYLS